MWDPLPAKINVTEAVVPDDFASGVRIDVFLAQKFPEFSRAFFQRCIMNGRVFLSGRTVRKSVKALPGNVIEIDWPDKDSNDEVVRPEDIPLDIIYEDDSIIVINKAPGIVVHPAHGNTTGTLVHGLLFHNEEVFEEMLDSYKRPGIVHRLDKDTSGVLIVAKNLDVWTTLKDTFREHNLQKIYYTILIGTPAEPRGIIEQPIGRHPTNRLKMAVVPDGKPSITHYKVISENNGCSLVKVRILTGRTHQIRVHFSHGGHPVLGDSLYGGKPSNAAVMPQRQMLHAWKLSIPHPVTQEIMTFCAPLPLDFTDTLEALGIPVPEDACEPQE